MDLEGIDYGDAIKRIADLITDGNIYGARQVALQMPPRIKRKRAEIIKPILSSEKITNKARNYNSRETMRVFVRDCFIDRYTNLRIVIPPALRIISEIIPLEFPYHKNWDETKCHSSYYDLSATIDHLIPVAQGGTDDFENLVTTSMSKNYQKHSLSFEDLGWEIYKIDKTRNWDGLSNFYIEQCDKNYDILKLPYFKNWYNAVKPNLVD